MNSKDNPTNFLDEAEAAFAEMERQANALGATRLEQALARALGRTAILAQQEEHDGPMTLLLSADLGAPVAGVVRLERLARALEAEGLGLVSDDG